jgi:DNA-binding CsgD family transcriptional regulator/PAS domain-containing protein
MEDARTIILPPNATHGDDLGVRQLFDFFVESTGIPWAELVIRSHRSSDEQTLRRGLRDKTSVSVEIAIDDDTEAKLTVAGEQPPSDKILRLFAANLGRETHRLRLLAETELLRLVADATSSAVLLFGPAGNIIFANRRADVLLSKQTEEELTVSSTGDRPQPLFRLLCAKVEELLDGAGRLLWQDRLDVSDGSELTSELVALSSGREELGRVVVVILRKVVVPPEQRADEFAELHHLSPREHEVLRLLVQGFDTSGMADRLGISPHTVRDHLKNVFRKTSTRSRSELLSALTAGGNHQAS